MGKLIIVSAPSGTGKSTLVRYLLSQDLNLEFSISATSRPPRDGEQDGVDYYFLTPEEFKRRIANGEFLEYEEVYENTFYGTLKSEVDRLLDNGKNVIFDVDVKGGLNIKKIYGDQALSILLCLLRWKSCATDSKNAAPKRRKQLKNVWPKPNMK